VRTIIDISNSSGQALGIVIAKVLSQSIPELQSFVQARGEAPSASSTKLAIQAALLRATEIGTVAKSIDTDDQDALSIIEESEQQHVEDNTGENSSILSPDTAGALSLLVQRISQRMKKNVGSGAMTDFVKAMKTYSDVDNFDKISCKNVANAATGMVDEIDYVEAAEEINSGGGGSFWDNLFDGIDKVVDTITKVTGAINTTVGNVRGTTGGIMDEITNIGGAVGASSIDQYLKENWLKIVGVIVALIVLTIIIARVSRK
jgi:hypothetical protein